jgi:hypothetical protein
MVTESGQEYVRTRGRDTEYCLHVPWYRGTCSLACLNQCRTFPRVILSTAFHLQSENPGEPWGTVTSLPSTVSVISACRLEVDPKARRPRQYIVNISIRRLYPTLYPPCRAEVEGATTPSMPVDAGLDAEDTSRSMVKCDVGIGS